MKISIITASYNSATTIAETIRSVLEQTYTDIEYWIVDGGSTDGTMDIIKEYVPLFKGRMHYVSEPDKGIYDAMNKGIERCSGDVVGILNSDDCYTSNDVLQRVADEFIGDGELDAVYGDIHFIHSDNPQKVVRYYSSARFSPRWLRFGFMPAHPSFYLRRRRYLQVGLYSLDYVIASDFDMMVRLFHNQKIKAKYLCLDFVTMKTGGVSTKNVKNRLLISKEDVQACKRNGLYSNICFIYFKYLYKIFEFKFW